MRSSREGREQREEKREGRTSLESVEGARAHPGVESVSRSPPPPSLFSSVFLLPSSLPPPGLTRGRLLLDRSFPAPVNCRNLPGDSRIRSSQARRCLRRGIRQRIVGGGGGLLEEGGEGGEVSAETRHCFFSEVRVRTEVRGDGDREEEVCKNVALYWKREGTGLYCERSVRETKARRGGTRASLASLV